MYDVVRKEKNGVVLEEKKVHGEAMFVSNLRREKIRKGRKKNTGRISFLVYL